MFLSTGNFENGLGAWGPLNRAESVSAIVVNNQAEAKQGSSFMRFRTAVSGGSVAHDTQVPTAILHEQQGIVRIASSLSFSVWLRSSSGAPATGAVAIWDLSTDTASDTRFQVEQVWSQFTVGMDRPAYRVRVEIYLDQIEQWLDVDGAVLI
jgi:hypothetical protein